MSGQRNPVLTGGCQCGAVRYALYAEPEHASVCHCRMCQKAMGNAFAPFAAVRLDDFRWTRGKPSIFRSSPIVERGFCRDCGTPLSFRYTDGDRIDVSIGSLDLKNYKLPESASMKSQSLWRTITTFTRRSWR